MDHATRNVRTSNFKDQQNRLPAHIQRLAVLTFKTFCRDPTHPSLRLHFLEDNKRGQHLKGSQSVTITMQYRAIFVRDGDTNVWYWIGTHKDYDIFTGRR